jgi:hypothetical protein
LALGLNVINDLEVSTREGGISSRAVDAFSDDRTNSGELGVEK